MASGRICKSLFCSLKPSLPRLAQDTTFSPAASVTQWLQSLTTLFCLFILRFCNGMGPSDTVSPHQGCPGAQPKQSNHHPPYRCPCTPAPVPDGPGAGTGLICHRAPFLAASPAAVGPRDPLLRWQQGRLSTARLGVPQALNNGTERGSLFLLGKRTIINFIARRCAGGFPRFPKKLFLLYVSNNQTAPGAAAAGAGAGTGSTLGAGAAARACVRSPVKALQSSPLEASQLCQPCLSLHQSCQLG